MKKRGFTLIELIAVLVILAILALIVTPLVLNIIRKARISADKRSIDAYGRSIEIAVANHLLDTGLFPEDISSLTIEYSGDRVVCGKTKLNSDSSVYLTNCKVNGRSVDYTYGKYEPEKYARLVEDVDGNGEISVGDKYTYKVNETDTYNFYVLSIEEENVNLIMDRHICEDGTINYAEDPDGDYCQYEWHAGENNVRLGPDTIMAALYSGTKDWDNVPNMNLSYKDEGNGYKELNIVDGIGSITRFDGTVVDIELDNNKPIKARIPKMSELTVLGCSYNNGSCPAWLVENLKYGDVSSYSASGYTDRYAINNGITENIWGYWTLDSMEGNNDRSYSIFYMGKVYEFSTTMSSRTARPVITVPKSELLR